MFPLFPWFPRKMTFPETIGTGGTSVSREPRIPRPPGLVGHYTRCLDCTRYAPLPSDTAFWCPAVRGCPDVSLWVTCTAYEARPGTPPGPTAPSDMASTR